MRWPRRHRPRGRHRRQSWLHRHPAPAAVPPGLLPADPAAEPPTELLSPPGPVEAAPRGVELVYADGTVVALEPGSDAYERFALTADRLRATTD